ncbi:siderophore-interacting protein [Leucobacter chinensis]|uniref:siderophore-interacting protein n=1 Tax=Leucobacter chinensis TaxID=2851010 RepID=UPI00350F316F
MTIFRAVVTKTSQLSASLVRVTLGGEGVAEFVSTGIPDEYVRVFFPHGDDPHDISLPVPDGDWWSTPGGQPEAPMRTYTISGVNPEQGELDIDFVVHEAGVAGPWARAAQPGHVIGFNAPTGLYSPPAETTWQLLAADLTAVPAALRIAAGSTGLHTRLVIEIPGEADRFDPELPENVEVTWVIGGNGTGPSRLGEIVRSAVGATQTLDGGYIWVAGETAALRDVRKYLRRELGLEASRYKVIGYWTPVADWDEKYAALPEAVKRELAQIWEAAGAGAGAGAESGTESGADAGADPNSGADAGSGEGAGTGSGEGADAGSSAGSGVLDDEEVQIRYESRLAQLGL